MENKWTGSKSVNRWRFWVKKNWERRDSEFKKVALPPSPTVAGLPPRPLRQPTPSRRLLLPLLGWKPLQVRERRCFLILNLFLCVRFSRAPVSQSEIKRPRQLEDGSEAARKQRAYAPFLPPGPLEPPWSCWGLVLKHHLDAIVCLAWVGGKKNLERIYGNAWKCCHNISALTVELHLRQLHLYYRSENVYGLSCYLWFFLSCFGSGFYSIAVKVVWYEL